MLSKNDFFAFDWHSMGKGVKHQYQVQANGKAIYDRTTHLTWQQGGSENKMDFKETEQHVDKLNREEYGGYSDWRLPTLEEAMSLVGPKKNEDTGLYIADIFDKTQEWVWTSDLLYSASRAWFAGFYYGSCGSLVFGLLSYVRAVRSAH